MRVVTYVSWHLHYVYDVIVTSAFSQPVWCHSKSRVHVRDVTWEVSFDYLSGATWHVDPNPAMRLCHVTCDDRYQILKKKQQQENTTLCELLHQTRSVVITWYHPFFLLKSTKTPDPRVHSMQSKEHNGLATSEEPANGRSHQRGAAMWRHRLPGGAGQRRQTLSAFYRHLTANALIKTELSLNPITERN